MVTPVTEFLGWSAHLLDNGLVRAVVVPDIGGRVLQFWLGDHPYLFMNPHLAGRLFTPAENWGDGTIASWKNYGGNKTWPAPQGWSGHGEWAGPPDPVRVGPDGCMIVSNGHGFRIAGVQATGRALVAALSQVEFPTTEVHISNPIRRGPASQTAAVSRSVVAGFGIAGYALALRGIRDQLAAKK